MINKFDRVRGEDIWKSLKRRGVERDTIVKNYNYLGHGFTFLRKGKVPKKIKPKYTKKW